MELRPSIANNIAFARFGGVTVYARSPVEGEWKPNGARSETDDLVILEVMAAELDVSWWKAYRKDLELAFHQESILCRASRVEVL